MKKSSLILLLSVITCLPALAKDLSDVSIKSSVPDLLVIKLLLFGEVISAEIPGMDELYWLDASAKLTVEEIKLAKSITDNTNKNRLFYNIEKVESSKSNKGDFWVSTYREFDKNSQKATGNHVSAMWYKSPSLGWHLAEISTSGSVSND